MHKYYLRKIKEKVWYYKKKSTQQSISVSDAFYIYTKLTSTQQKEQIFLQNFIFFSYEIQLRMSKDQTKAS